MIQRTTHGRLLAAGIVGFSLLLTGCAGDAVGKANKSARTGTGFVVKELAATKSGKPRKYGVFVPLAYDGTKQYPVILFLHGLFEGGDNPEKAFDVGIGPAIAERAGNFEYIVVIPQTHGDWKENSADLADAYTALQEVKQQYNVDPNRIILSGLSIGGYGVWALAQQHPGEFAALVPMCGYDKPDAVPAIKHIPTFVFHNSMDPFVSVGDSRSMVKAIQAAGGSAKLKEYGAIGHDCWDRAYREDELWKWMADQRKKS
jgi:predicted peptidase